VFAAADWLAAQELSEDHSRAISSLSQQLARDDPERAFAWAMATPAGPARDGALTNAYRAWSRKDPAAARAALEAAELPEHTRTKLEPAAGGNSPGAESTRRARTTLERR
jgi:hypothetical protein